jgi:hypothetical protein
MKTTFEADKMVLVKTETSLELDILDWKHKKHSFS